jgi:hypothetical protein
MGQDKQVFWLAIDKEYTSFSELLHRRVIAQGWGAINLTSLLTFVEQDQFPKFSEVFQSLYANVYATREDSINVAEIFWMLLSIKAGDLIVGIEGTAVKGIVEASTDALSSYQHQQHYEYANSVCSGVNWIEWSEVHFGFTPTPSGQGVKGIKNLNTERQEVLSAWEKYKSSR